MKTLDKQKMKHLKAAAPSGGDSWFFCPPFKSSGIGTSHTVDGSEIPRPTSGGKGSLSHYLQGFIITVHPKRWLALGFLNQKIVALPGQKQVKHRHVDVPEDSLV